MSEKNEEIIFIDTSIDGSIKNKFENFQMILFLVLIIFLIGSISKILLRFWDNIFWIKRRTTGIQGQLLKYVTIIVYPTRTAAKMELKKERLFMESSGLNWMTTKTKGSKKVNNQFLDFVFNWCGLHKDSNGSYVTARGFQYLLGYHVTLFTVEIMTIFHSNIIPNGIYSFNFSWNDTHTRKTMFENLKFTKENKLSLIPRKKFTIM